MKKIIFATLLSFSIFTIGCNSSNSATNTVATKTSTENNITDQATSTVETTSTEETTVESTTKKLVISVVNNCQADIGMFSVIDPVTKEQINLDALANGELISFEAEWPVEIETFQWAIYNIDGDLYMEGDTNISTANTNVNLLLNGNGSIEDVVESFE